MHSGHAGTQGFQPSIAIGPGNPEAAKYGRLWGEFPEYRAHAPGEALAQTFLAQARPKAGASCIDFGCGTGRGALALVVFGGLNVTMVDFVGNSLDDDIRPMLTTQTHTLRFLKHDLERPLPIVAEYGFCTDVMEHIPPDKVGRVLDHVLNAAQHVFFSIATAPDRCGALIGEELHLTVRPFAWWLEQFSQRGVGVHWSKDCGETALFYVTAWASGEEVVKAGILNTATEAIRANVRANVTAGWAQVQPHEANDLEVCILGGGPSLAAYEDDIREKKAAGAKIVTLNGAYKWALDHDLGPVTQVMVDAREFNKRFVEPVREDCLYLIGSQCHPAVLEALPRHRTLLWHTSTEDIADVLETQYPGGWWSIRGGSTVLLRSIPLLRMLGYRKFHLYGCDSCLGDEERHHAYAQPENDTDAVIPVIVGGRVFACHPWMASQANEFIDLIRIFGDEVEIAVHGEGLLAWTLEYAAQQQDQADNAALTLTEE